MKKFLIILLLLCNFIILASGCKKREARILPSGNTVKIGLIAPMSGPEQTSGENTILGIRTALQMQPYLHNGDKVELVVEDNAGTTEQTLTALAKLSGQEDIAGVLLMAKSNTVLAIVPVADQHKMPILALIATHPDITKNNRFIAQLGFDDNYQGKVAALYVRDEMLLDRVAVVSEQENAHFSYLANAFMLEYTSVGGKIIEHVIVEQQTAQLGKVLERLRANNVQLLYLAVSSDVVIRLVRAAAEIGWKPKMMGSDGLMAHIALQHRDEIKLVEGMMATDFYSSSQPKTEYGRKAWKFFKKNSSGQLTTYTALSCEGTSIFLNAVDRCENKKDRECVNNMLRDTQKLDGLLGKIGIHENGKAERPIFVNFIKNQKMKFLVKVY